MACGCSAGHIQDGQIQDDPVITERSALQPRSGAGWLNSALSQWRTPAPVLAVLWISARTSPLRASTGYAQWARFCPSPRAEAFAWTGGFPISPVAAGDFCLLKGGENEGLASALLLTQRQKAFVSHVRRVCGLVVCAYSPGVADERLVPIWEPACRWVPSSTLASPSNPCQAQHTWVTEGASPDLHLIALSSTGGAHWKEVVNGLDLQCI